MIEIHKVSISQEVINYINTLDFSMIIKKMVREQSWTQKEAEEVVALYKNFLLLKKKYQYELPPSEEIDEVWHNHILDTLKYEKDCKFIFGEYLHHYPYFGI